jgi:hypothetical protein
VAQHLSLRASHGYTVSTLRPLPVLGAVRGLRDRRPGMLVAVAGLELAARALGAWDFRVRRRDYLVWAAAPSTKA